MTCPNCQVPFEHLNKTRAEYREPEVGSLLLCGNCAHISVVERPTIIVHKDEDLLARAITSEEFKALDRRDLQELNQALKCIIARLRSQKKRIIVPSWYGQN